MGDFSTTQLLIVVNVYVLLGLALFALSGSDLICWSRRQDRSARRHRLWKLIVAVPLALSCLALLAIGLFAVGMSHGAQPKTYQIILFILGCLTPCLLLLLWVLGSLLVDGLWCLLTIALVVYFVFINPALYVRYWAEDSYQWAQMWMARHYQTGTGGLDQSESTARSWYKKGAESGNMEAQYIVARSTRHGKTARTWYLRAAEQGHVGAMIRLARISGNKEERRKWLDQAAAYRHPDALFMLAQAAMATDLATARKLTLEAAEGTSRSAILMLIEQYLGGGILFDQDEALAGKWQAVLEKSPPVDSDPQALTEAFIAQHLSKGRAVGKKISANNPDTLFRQARRFLSHPAKDQILHDRAVAYLKRAVESGHGEAAVTLAKLAVEKAGEGTISPDTIGWLEIAAAAGNRYALGELTRYHKNKPGATVDDLDKSIAYNIQLLQRMEVDEGSRQRLQRQHWGSEYRDSVKKQKQLNRLGGSWEAAEKLADIDPGKEYLLAKEMEKARQYGEGMERMQSAAIRGNSDARFELARRVLYGPRSFEQEVEAISELQELDRLDFLPASFQLGLLYQSGTGVVPKNIYLARQLFRKCQEDQLLQEKSVRLLGSTPSFTDSLDLIPGTPSFPLITKWYERELNEVEDSAQLKQQFETLLDHYRDPEQLIHEAEGSDKEAQYNLAQSLQSHDLGEAMQWLTRAAENGNSRAQYELAVRMIRGKKNMATTQQTMRRWAKTAAGSGHVGAMVFLADKYTSGRGGFVINKSLAVDYYRRVLEGSEKDIIFQDKIAGRSITIKRDIVKRSALVLGYSGK